MDDISTEELSDISQDNTDSQKDLLSPSKREGELLAQIADIEEKLELNPMFSFANLFYYFSVSLPNLPDVLLFG